MSTLSDAKVITPIFTRDNGRLSVEYEGAFDGNVIGYFATQRQADEALNDHVLDLLIHGLLDSDAGPDYPEPDDIPNADPAPGRSALVAA